MHKDDAAKLFSALGDENAVKMVKMLYNKGDMSFDKLKEVVGCSLLDFNKALEAMLGCELVIMDNDICSLNKELLNTLLKFLVTPCGCTHK